MAFKIVYRQSVLKDLSRASKAEAGRILDRIESDLAERADSCLPSKGRFAGLRKYRIGDYRVIFAIIDDEAVILRIGDKKDVCRKET